MATTQNKPKVGAAQIKLLERLSNACAVSGDEGAVRKIVLEEIEGYADEISTDALGNVLAVKRGKGRNRPKVMLAAHMDEVGFMLTHDEGGGLYRFVVAGGMDPRNLAGKQVLVGPDETPGVIGSAPIHLTSASERRNAITLDQPADRYRSGECREIQDRHQGNVCYPIYAVGPEPARQSAWMTGSGWPA